MRKIFVTEFISVDGVIQDPHEWHFPYFGDDAGNFKETELVGTGALLLGRVTYEGFAEAWPGRGEDMTGKPEPTDPTSETHFTDRFNWLPKYVVSDSLTEAEATWHNSHILRGDGLVEALDALKREDGKDIAIHGSGRLVNSLMGSGVIDEYRLMVHPIVVGKGQRLFPDGVGNLGLRLEDVTPYSKGVVVLTYAPGNPEGA
jgi:dihydrofolate reductase